jgi:glycine/D-amino acid oxidase-like deaminating enzyme
MTNDSSFPDAVDVDVIGGGIIGICTAYALAKAGVRVAVFEKGTLACEQSSRNWGWVRTLGRDLPEVPIAMRAQQLWGEIQSQVDVGFRQTGMLYLEETEGEAAGHDAWLKKAKAYGLDARLMRRESVEKMLPPSNRKWTGAMFSESDGVAEPAIATAGIALLARCAGALIFERCAARGIEFSAGRASAVVTERGRVKAGSVVLAGGAWSRLFCGNVGAEFPQLKVRGSVLRTSPIDTPLAAAINGGNFTCRKRADGGYTVSQFGASMADLVPDNFRLMSHFFRSWMANNSLIRLRFGKRFFQELAIPRKFALDRVSPFEKCRVLDPKPSERGTAQAWQRLTSAFPVFQAARIAQTWAGYIDVTPDALPVMSPVDAFPGFYLASGFSGHGFGIGPAAGEIMADMVMGNNTFTEIEAFRFSRFSR